MRSESPTVSKRTAVAERCGTNAHSYGQKSWTKKSFRRPSRRWNDNIKCQKMSVGVNWIHLISAAKVPMVGVLWTWACILGFHKMWKFLVQLRIRQLFTKAALLLSKGSALVSERVLCLGSTSSKTDLLPPWSRVFHEKLICFQLLKKFPAFYGTRRFITAFTSDRHLSLSSTSSIQSIPPHRTSWRSFPPIYASVSQAVSFARFPTKTLYKPLLSPIHATHQL